MHAHDNRRFRNGLHLFAECHALEIAHVEPVSFGQAFDFVFVLDGAVPFKPSRDVDPPGPLSRKGR